MTQFYAVRPKIMGCALSRLDLQFHFNVIRGVSKDGALKASQPCLGWVCLSNGSGSENGLDGLDRKRKRSCD